MDYPEENYDPDCDVSRFLTFPDPLEGLMLSPDDEQLRMPLAAPPLLPALPQSVPHGNAEVHSFPSVVSRTSAADPQVPSVKSEPLSVEGVIISAMEQVHIEGAWSMSAKNDDETPYEPIFEQYLPGQRDCTCCVTLREVSHSSPNRNLIFTVHGGLGTFDHAVFDVEYFKGGQLFKHELFYVDLSTRSHDWVKSFMVGCVTLLHTDTTGNIKDSLASFYDTLCADMNTPIEEALEINFGPTLCFEDAGDCLIQLPHVFEIGETSRTKNDVLNDNGLKIDLPVEKKPTIVIPNPAVQSPFGSTSTSASSPTVTSTDSMQVSGSSGDSPFVIDDAKHTTSVEPPDAGRRAPARTPLALQRQRTANMRLFELANYLHLPMAEAARRLKVCSTALKHVCRRNGLARWPSRQIQAIDRQIAKLEHDMVQGNRRGGLLMIKEAIEALQKKKTAIYEKMLNDY